MEIIKKVLKSVKNSIKSVTVNFKEFIGIYIAVLIVQLLLGIWTMSAFTNYFANDTLFNNQFRYDVLISSEDEASLNTLEGIFRNDLGGSGIKKNPVVTGYGKLDDKLGVNIKKGELEKFENDYKKYLADDDISYETTPKYTYHSEIRDGTIVSSVIIGLIAFVISVFIMSVMYSVRTNHYKFQYGIYMTFGADKKMLGRIAMGELLTINTLLLVPAYLIAYLLTLTVYSASGVSILISLPQLLIYIALSYVVVLIASSSSLGELFLKPPVALISTSDNSNFVSSPRRSFHLFGKNIPYHYELATAWRFRKYLIRLVAGAVAFSVIFVVGIYSANILLADQSAANEEFLLKFKRSTKVEDYRKEANQDAYEIVEKLGEVKFVDSVSVEQSVRMKSRSDHLLLQSGADAYGSGYTVSSRNELDGFIKAMNNCRYVCVDELALKLYEEKYDVDYLEGYDADSLPYAENMIIISEGLYGKNCFDFKPGDKVVVADMKFGDSNLPRVSDQLEILKQQIENFTFEYTEFTVGAVINDRDATESIIVGLSEKDYRILISEKRAISEISVNVESGLDVDEIASVRDDVSAIMADYDSWNVEFTDASVFAIVDERINLPGLLYLMSSLVLIITPVIWIFSQVMFFKKRELEFTTLRHMGATMKEIKRIHLVSGGVLFAIGFIANYFISRLSCFIIFEIFTSFLPSLGILGMSVSFDSFVPWYVMLIYAVISAFCGFMSSMIPYFIYKSNVIREQKMTEQIEFE